MTITKQLPQIDSIVYALVSYDISEYRVVERIDENRIKVVLAQDKGPNPLEHIIGKWWKKIDDIPKYLFGGAV